MMMLVIMSTMTLTAAPIFAGTYAHLALCFLSRAFFCVEKQKGSKQSNDVHDDKLTFVQITIFAFFGFKA